MDAHTLRVLEFARVVALVAARAPSSLGRELLDRAEPTPSRRAALERQRETTQMRALRARSGSLPWQGSQDVTAHLDRLRAENSWIEGPPLVQVADFAAACGRIARAVAACHSRLRAMGQAGNCFYECRVSMRTSGRAQFLRPVYALREGMPCAGAQRRQMVPGNAAGGYAGCAGM